MDISNRRNAVLGYKNKQKCNHTYVLNLSSFIDQHKMNQHDKTCHLCCLFASECIHRFRAFNYSSHFDTSKRDGKHSDAVYSLFDIWQDSNRRLDQNRSPLHDIPLCFHRNFSFSNENPTSLKRNLHANESFDSIEKTVSSCRSYESLLRRLPNPLEIKLSQSSTNDDNLIEPIRLIDDIQSKEDEQRSRNISHTNQALLIPTKESSVDHACNNDSLVHRSSLSDVNYSQRKKQKVEHFSSTNHQSNEKSTLIDGQSIRSTYENVSTEITIGQFIKDLNTNIETSINTTPKRINRTKPNRINELESPQKYSPNDKSPDKCNLSPSVPKCLNEYLQMNLNSNKSKRSDQYIRVNVFDSLLFQWQICHSNQNENYFCRKNLSALPKRNRTSLQSFIDNLQLQRQYVPIEYASWMKTFRDYRPLNFSLTMSYSKENMHAKNPYGRTGLIGRSLLEQYGANRYRIWFIVKQECNQKYILLQKNRHHKWELPKSKTLKKNLPCHTLDIVYIDHPLNTDDAWIEVELLLVQNLFDYFHKKTWFLMKSLHKLNNIEHFDFDLIQFYM